MQERWSYHRDQKEAKGRLRTVPEFHHLWEILQGDKKGRKKAQNTRKLFIILLCIIKMFPRQKTFQKNFCCRQVSSPSPIPGPTPCEGVVPVAVLIWGPCPCCDQGWTSDAGRTSPCVWNCDKRNSTETVAPMPLGTGAVPLQGLVPTLPHSKPVLWGSKIKSHMEEARLQRGDWNRSLEKGRDGRPRGHRGSSSNNRGPEMCFVVCRHWSMGLTAMSLGQALF